MKGTSVRHTVMTDAIETVMRVRYLLVAAGTLDVMNAHATEIDAWRGAPAVVPEPDPGHS